MVKITIDSQLRIPCAQLTPEIEAELQEEFTHVNPEHKKQKRFSRFSKIPPFIKMWQWDHHNYERVLSLPRGGAQRVREILRSHGLKWEWDDIREQGVPDACGLIPKHEPGGYDNPGLPLWEHQDEVATMAVKRQNCLARAPTGSGKTSAAIAAVERLQVPTIIMVYDGALFRQWIERIEKELNIPAEDVGVIGEGKFDLKPVTIAMQQSLMRMGDEKWNRVNQYFGCFIVDEVQRSAAASFLKVINRSPAKYRIGISADETRKDRKEFLIYDLFGDVAVEVTLDELIDRKLVHDVRVRIVPTNFSAPWYVKQRMRKGMRPDFHRLLEQMANDKERNELATSFALNEIAANNRQVVLFGQRREHAPILNQIAAENNIKSGTLLGGVGDKSEFVRTVERLNSGELSWAAGTLQAAGTGLDIPSVSCGLILSPIHNNRQLFGQVRGRMCRISKRTGKKDAVIYYMYDRSLFGTTPVKNLRAWNNVCEVAHKGKWVSATDYLKATKGEKDDYREEEEEKFELIKPASALR